MLFSLTSWKSFLHQQAQGFDHKLCAHRILAMADPLKMKQDRMLLAARLHKEFNNMQGQLGIQSGQGRPNRIFYKASVLT